MDYQEDSQGEKPLLANNFGSPYDWAMEMFKLTKLQQWNSIIKAKSVWIYYQKSLIDSN